MNVNIKMGDGKNQSYRIGIDRDSRINEVDTLIKFRGIKGKIFYTLIKNK